MSILTASLLGLLIISLSNGTVNGSIIRLFCQYPDSELCDVYHHRLMNNLNRLNAEDEPLFISLGEDYPTLSNQHAVEAIERSLLTNDYNELLRCINLGDDSCNNGSLPGSGKDDDFLIGDGNPGKRSQSDLNKIKNEQKISQFDKLGNLRRLSSNIGPKM